MPSVCNQNRLESVSLKKQKKKDINQSVILSFHKVVLCACA